VQCVKVAGLCHDLGHGPFSHVFDNQFMARVRPDLRWSHERASAQMLELLVSDNGIELARADVEFIQDLILGEPRPSCTDARARKGYLFDIVANKRNSVDVDKFDYIQRDCYNVGIKSSLDALRLIHFTRVLDNQICFNQKEVFNLYELFHTRYSLFKRVYTHKVSQAIEYMIVDALVAADPFLQ
jgi:HD superfamily phosphohydrolase